MKRNAKFSKCPLKLKWSIEMANTLRAGHEFSSNAIVWMYGAMNTETVSSLRKRFIEILNEIPREFIEYNVWISDVVEGRTRTYDKSMKDSPDPLVQDFCRDYEKLLEESTWVEAGQEAPSEDLIPYSPLRRLGVALSVSQQQRKQLLEIISWNGRSEEDKTRGFKSSSTFRISIRDGAFYPSLGYLFDLIISEKIDTSRLLECPSCRRIVWKKKSNAVTCGETKCAQRNKYIHAKERKKQLEEEGAAMRDEWRNRDFSV